MTASMDEVAGNVDELAGAAEDTVASIAVIDGSIKQVEENTSATQRLSEEVSEFASRGATSVRETIAGINEIQEITDEAREVINRLGTQMEAVGRILTVIGDVAEQTNLLALNAAIIAAAAGEHGKGFAVVADEIKDLADRTSTSTKEIAGLIRSVQTESRRAIDAMQRGSGSVRRGVELANHAGEALQQILSSVQQVTEMAKDIAKTTAEHSTITRNITKSMTNISSMVRQIKRAVTEQSSSGSRVNRVSEQMRDDARFVFRSANEQVQAATGVTKNMERISEMVSFVSKAMSEQSNGVNHVAKVAEEVRDTIEQERAQIADLEEITDRIGRQASEFSRYLEAFDKEGELQT
jgi:methyl-accepting chemotaxis protein